MPLLVSRILFYWKTQLPSHPLRDCTMNNPIQGFPTIPVDIATMSMATINAVLQALELPVTSPFEVKHQRLKTHIGLVGDFWQQCYTNVTTEAGACSACKSFTNLNTTMDVATVGFCPDSSPNISIDSTVSCLVYTITSIQNCISFVQLTMARRNTPTRTMLL